MLSKPYMYDSLTSYFINFRSVLNPFFHAGQGRDSIAYVNFKKKSSQDDKESQGHKPEQYISHPLLHQRVKFMSRKHF